MRIWELASGINVVMTEEESKLLNRFLKETKPTLNEREEVVAQHLVQKDVLVRAEKTGQLKINSADDLWRD